jgi:hypothetical protein
MEGPAVAEDDGLSASPVLVVDLDIFVVLFTDCNVVHVSPFFSIYLKMDD